MSQKIQLTLKYDEDLEEALKKECGIFTDFRILAQSLDARNANRGKIPKYHYTIEVIKEGEKFCRHGETFKKLGPFKSPPIIVGAGPAGLFCALRLAEYGVKSIIVERGSRASRRMLAIAKHWRYGEFNPENNVCYGEGGAGLFSDGKLITRIKSPYVHYILRKLVEFGAPKEIAFISNPHLGSNKIRVLIAKITDKLKSLGVEFYYNTRVDELILGATGRHHGAQEGTRKEVQGVLLNTGGKLYSQHVVLATGHSAQEMYRHLKEKKVAMDAKSFAVGVRIEHPRREIDRIQYGRFAKSGALGAARYRMSFTSPETQRGTYSFCMCPGGHVLSAGTDAEGIVVNGMSNFSRSAPWSNAALVVEVNKEKDFAGGQDVLSGLCFQREIEGRAWAYSKELAGGKELPAERVRDFLNSGDGVKKALPKSSTPSGIFPLALKKILPPFIVSHLQRALLSFEKSLPGFTAGDALLLAPETRTSAPVTILRDLETLQSLSHLGLYPCGEGAGYAGGITSAAVDGVKVAMSLIEQECSFSDS